MLEECGLPYRIHPIDISKGDQFKPDFLAISPNNKIPAIVDPDGPGGKPISVFEIGRHPAVSRPQNGQWRIHKTSAARVEVDQWLFWQMGGLGPMAGQAHHFRLFSKEKIPYAIERYTTEVTRLYGVFDRALEGRDFIAGAYSIADIASYPWMMRWERQGQVLSAFPNVSAWMERVGARPAVKRGMSEALK